MNRFLMITILLFCVISGKTQNVFHWKWELTNEQIKVTGKIDSGQEKAITLEADIIKKRFGLLYDIIDKINYRDIKRYLKTVDTLSSQLVFPFAKELSQCRSVIIEIDSLLLNLPVEFLINNKKAIAINKPLVFTINNYAVNKNDSTIKLHKGFIVRDSTSDPENACLTTLYNYPKSGFKSASKITAKDLTLKPGIDFMLISAHGDADSITFRGGITLNKIDNVPPLFFKENNCKLVYIDGCQQGINWAYIAALAQTHETNFYLGPIVSNDSGESSTKTINWFFSFLKQTDNPVLSLFKTRVKLYNHYNKKINKMDVINKSYIFRIYKL
jgi:hypothetical protein